MMVTQKLGGYELDWIPSYVEDFRDVGTSYVVAMEEQRCRFWGFLLRWGI